MDYKRLSEQWQGKAQRLEKIQTITQTHTHTHIHSCTCVNTDTQTVSTHNYKWWLTRCNYSVFIYFLSALHVSGDSFAHHQEPITVFYSFGYCQPIMLLAEIERQFHLIHDTSQQQYWLTIPKAVSTVMCFWWWARESPKTCRADKK
jgi:hypothetical protein